MTSIGIQLLLNEYHRWILWVPVFLGIGVGFYFSLTFEPAWYASFSVLIMSSLAAWFYRHNQFIMIVFVTLAITATGFTVAKLRTSSVSHLVLEKEVGPTRITGLVTEVQSRSSGYRLVIENLSIGWLDPFETPERIRININTNKGDKIIPGNWVRVYGVLRPPQEPASPGAFDFQRYAYFKEFGATGFTYGAAEVIHQSTELTLSSALERLRTHIGNNIRTVVPGTTGTVAAALITGDRGAIPEATVDAMRDAGLAHLLAISGLHIGLVAGFVFFCVRAGLALIPPLAVRYPIKSWAALVAITAAMGYTLISGATIPTLRAFTMMTLVLGAVMIGRRGISMRLVAWAATVILLLRPESLWGASFQLSFAAVIGLVAAYEYLNHRFSRMWHSTNFFGRILLYIAGVGFSTIIASLSTAPFAAYHFHQLASFGLVSNLLAVPLTALWIMPSALLGMVLMPFGFEEIGLIPMGWGIDIVIVAAENVAVIPGNVQRISQIPFAALMLFVGGGIWLCLWGQAWRLMGGVAIAAAIVLSINPERPLIIAAANGELFGVQLDGSLAVVGPGASGNRFTQKVWLERAALQKMPRSSNAYNNDLRCDGHGCVLVISDRTISLAWDEAALFEDCWRSDVVLSTIPIRRNCAEPSIVIDRFDLWRNGAHALYSDGTTIRVESTFSIRGTRPWTGKRSPQYNNHKS